MYLHRLYDLVVACSRPLPAPRISAARPNVIITEYPHRRIPSAPPNPHGYTYAKLPDESIHVSWSGLFDFIVSADGSRIDVHADATWHREPVYTYLLSQVVSVALLGQHIESWHGSAVALEQNAIVLLGNCGYGKSTLTAALVQSGAKLLTDDLVVLRTTPNSTSVVPGAFRLKLDPHTANTLGLSWTSVPMQDGSGKHVYKVAAMNCASTPATLQAFVVLQPSDRLALDRIERADAIHELLRATFNPLQTDRDRLQQLLFAARTITARVPVLRLQVPRSLPRLDDVMETVRALIR